MSRTLQPLAFLNAQIPFIDVRSPGEYVQGHIPAAHNLPLFSDAERALVGTLYKQQGRDAAMLEGLRIVGPKMAPIVEKARIMAPGGKIGVHCWRGGERSGSVAWLLEKAGFPEVCTLQRGYKAFRELVLSSFSMPKTLLILGGYTGTGKTEMLALLREQGEQVIDLEGLAQHKGSAYGGIGKGVQPTTEHFENLLWEALSKQDPLRPIWLEDESQMVGHVKVPDAFYAQMRSAKVAFVDMPIEQRAARLVADYGSCPKAELEEATLRIQKRLGPQHTKEAMGALDRGDLLRVAMITLTYYDKAYGRGISQRDPGSIRKIPANGLGMPALVQLLKDERTHKA